MHRAAPEQAGDPLDREVRALERELVASVGPSDVAYLVRLHHLNRALKWIGRGLAAFLPGPLMLVGAVVLAINKQLSVGPLGHDIYHGAWEGVEGAEAFAVQHWQWDAPIDKATWQAMHNRAHHAHTGTAHRDVDNHFLFVRINPHVETDPVLTPVQGLIVPACLLGFTHVAHMQYLGVFDQLALRLSRNTVRKVPVGTRQALREWWRSIRGYAAEHYLLGPACFGPYAPKVFAAELIAGRMRDLALFYFAYATHAGPDSAWTPETHRSRGRGGWLRDRIAVSYNTRLPRALSLLYDAVDLHIEHHVFPRLPSHKLAEAAPRLRAICERHGVPYRVESISSRLWTTFAEFWRLRDRRIRGRQ